MKSSVEAIRARFDEDVERFSDLQTGQSATVDAPLVLDLIARTAAAVNPRATHALDVGCGAGNYALKLLEVLPDLHFDLIDLSEPMLERAKARLTGKTDGTLRLLQTDVRDAVLEPGRYDVIVAAASLHHLRTDEEWRQVFASLFKALKPGGSFWISDLITHSTEPVQDLMWLRYGDYLTALKDDAYREHVFAYIEKEDTPKPLVWQLELLRELGFAAVEVLHKNSSFAAFGGIKAAQYSATPS